MKAQEEEQVLFVSEGEGSADEEEQQDGEEAAKEAEVVCDYCERATKEDGARIKWGLVWCGECSTDMCQGGAGKRSRSAGSATRERKRRERREDEEVEFDRGSGSDFSAAISAMQAQLAKSNAELAKMGQKLKEMAEKQGGRGSAKEFRREEEGKWRTAAKSQ